MSIPFRTVFLLVALVFFVPGMALGYGGPGSVISGIGAFLAAVAAVLAALFGFIWFPLKRLYQKMTNEDTPCEEPATSQANEPSE